MLSKGKWVDVGVRWPNLMLVAKEQILSAFQLLLKERFLGMNITPV